MWVLPDRWDLLDVGMSDRRRATSKDDLARASLASHRYNLSACGTTHDTVVNQEHTAVLELGVHGAELPAHTLLASFLTRHNECAENVAVLDEAHRIGLLETDGSRCGGSD